ncbi:MAG: ABC transporter permease [Gammaproteobacteria bacterium]|nr:ABC transporter permease [Gammaproteobacteria bacterium]
MKFLWQRAGAIAKKETRHVLRDPFTLALSIGLPVFMVFVFGFAIEFNVKDIHLAVHDADRSQASRRLIDTFGSSHYFVIDNIASPDLALRSIAGERDRAALIIPAGFEQDLLASRRARAQVLLDGSDNSTVGPILSYVASIQTIAGKRIANFDPPTPIDFKTRYLFNAELNSRWFIIPGLAVVVMAILSVLLTALTVAREWENGSMELLLSTPTQPLEIIVGKLAPYAVLGLTAVAFVYLISRTVFGVPFVGSHLVFLAGCILFLATYLAQGLLISVVTRKQQIAMQIAIMSGLLPAQLLSGFIFPIESMPTFFQYFTMILPARWFMTIARESYLKGSTFLDMAGPFLALAILCTIMIVLATSKFKKDLEP